MSTSTLPSKPRVAPPAGDSQLQREIALRRLNEEQFRIVFDHDRTGMALVGLDGRLLRVNPAFCELLGHSSDELLESEPSRLVRSDDLATEMEEVRHLLEIDGIAYRMEKRYIHREGHTVPVLFEATLVRDGSGRPLHFIAQAQDLTRGKQVEEDWRRAHAAAESASRAKSEFLALMSHEIRTPLTAIIGFTEILLEDPTIARLPLGRLTDLRTIRENGEHLLDLVNDLLDLSRVDSGRFTIRLGPCRPVDVLEDVLAMVRPRAEAKGLGLELEVIGSVPDTIRSDRTRLRQVLNNLVSNAVKFTRAGEVRAEVTSIEGGRALAFRIRDTGIGMSEQTVAMAFQPFFRGDDPLVRQAGGTGLGLAISQRIAERLGGTIRAESAPGVGSSFTFSLPIEVVTAPMVPTRAASLDGATRERPRLNRRVLLAEDNDATRRICRTQLERAGATVVVATNGQEALETALAEQAAGRPFDIVLMDMQMPVLDGYQATRQLRAQGFARPIVALTAYAMAEDREQCLGLGCTEHVSKPIDWAALLDLLARLA